MAAAVTAVTAVAAATAAVEAKLVDVAVAAMGPSRRTASATHTTRASGKASSDAHRCAVLAIG